MVAPYNSTRENMIRPFSQWTISFHYHVTKCLSRISLDKRSPPPCGRSSRPLPFGRKTLAFQPQRSRQSQMAYGQCHPYLHHMLILTTVTPRVSRAPRHPHNPCWPRWPSTNKWHQISYPSHHIRIILSRHSSTNIWLGNQPHIVFRKDH
jgi:hypothetical protein